MPEKNELIVAEKIKPEELLVQGRGVDDLLKMIRKKAYDHGQDISTDKNREIVRSIAHDIARSKTFLVSHADKIKKPHAAIIVPVNKNIKKIKDTLNALKTEYRQPLTDYENAEEKRIAEEKAEKERLFKEKIDKRVDQLAFYSSVATMIPYRELSMMSDEEFDGNLAAAHKAFDDKQIRIAEEKRLEDERVAKVAADQEAERVRLADERKAQEEAATKVKAELDRIASEQVEQQAKVDAKNARVAAELAAKQDEIDAKEKAVQDEKNRLERIEFEKKAKEDAKIQADIDAKAAAEKAESEKQAEEAVKKAEDERQEKLRPDKEKLSDWLFKLREIPDPDLTDAHVREVWRLAAEQIYVILDDADRNLNRL